MKKILMIVLIALAVLAAAVVLLYLGLFLTA